MYRDRGFTLAELLIVIAIIGILSTVVLASLDKAREKGRDSNRITEIKELQLALELYYDANDRTYPADLSSLSPTYISVVPKDPESDGSCGGEYCYAQVNGGSSYHLAATLETDNDVLEEDSDSTASFQGSGADCQSGGSPERCYDFIP